LDWADTGAPLGGGSQRTVGMPREMPRGRRRTIEKGPTGVKPRAGLLPWAMRWDPLLVEAVARELDRTLERARVRSLLLEPDARRVLLYLREGTLVLELHPTAGWISLLEPGEPSADARPLAARVRGVRALPDESVLVLSLQRIRGRDEGVELVVEFTGNRWNALVVGNRSRQIRHVLLPREEKTRSLTVGAPYQPPPSTGRNADPSPAWWTETVGGEDRSTLLRSVAWTSSLNALVFLEGGQGAATPVEGEPLSDPRVLPGVDGHGRWLRMRDPERWNPRILKTDRGLQPYPISVPGVEEDPTETFLEAIRRARMETEGDSEASLRVPAALLARGERRVERLRRRAEGMARELARARDPGPVRSVGDLILARFGEIRKGAGAVTLTDFQGNEVEVELDPTLPPHENAKRYYDEAARLERVREDLPDRIAAARGELSRWEALLSGVATGTTPPEALAEALGPDRGVGRGKGGKERRRGDQPTAPPYRRYRSSGGLEIRVGRGARHNDDLTFHHSAPDDIWLHVREAPGAHVILRWGREENPPARDLEEAAVLAALGSEARHAGVVPVDWTRRKHVRKPRKAAPGAVIPGRVQTLFVEPDPALEKRLQAEE
jgi:predicted ribosome quality control (RQC) complex YloA/Tae2 family protein